MSHLNAVILVDDNNMEVVKNRKLIVVSNLPDGNVMITKDITKNVDIGKCSVKSLHKIDNRSLTLSNIRRLIIIAKFSIDDIAKIYDVVDEEIYYILRIAGLDTEKLRLLNVKINNCTITKFDEEELVRIMFIKNRQ